MVRSCWAGKIMRRVLTNLIIFLAIASAPLLGQGGGVRYYYDDAGRLIQVIDQNGSVATYSYDAVGNLLSITRSSQSGSGLAVLNFNPQSGPVGQTVTIQGQGFSTTPSADAVQFNGTAASVTAATATTLTVSVPSGATTGVISVTVGGQTTTSNAKFKVTAFLVSIGVSPAGASIGPAGQQQQFTATGTYSDGSQQNVTTAVIWTSSNPVAATISNVFGSAGLATSVGSGNTTIMATSGSISGSTTLTVAPLSGLAVTPASASITRGSTQQFTATGTLSGGSTIDVTKQVNWQSSPVSVATISNAIGTQGLATGTGVGTASECAVFPGFNGGSTACSGLTVTLALVSLAVTPANLSIPKGTQQQYTAIGTYNDGSTQNLTASVTWSSSNPSVATISNVAGSQGVATDVGVGTTTISASSGSVSNSTALTLSAAAPSSLAVSPGRVLIPDGNSYQFKATLNYTDGTTQDVTQTAAWSTADPTVANVSSAGFVTTVGVGSTILTATSASVSNSASVLVTSPTAAAVPRFVYENNADSTISVYSMNPSTGQLRSLGYAPGAGESSAFALDPASQFLYVANSFSSTAPNSVSAYTIATDGALTLVTGSPFATGNFPNAVATDPSGRFVFVVNSSDDTVSAFSIGLTGGLTPVSGSPFAVGQNPLVAEVDPSGQFLYVLNNSAATVSAFTIDPNSGTLSPITGSPFAAGVNPQSMTVDPSGKFLLVTNPGNSATSDATPPGGLPGSGANAALLLASLESRPLEGFGQLSGNSVPLMQMGIGAATRATHIEPAPWIAAPPPGATPSAISVFSINGVSGVLAPVVNSPFQVSGMPDSIAVDPTDRFVYVTYNSNLIDGFTFDATSGALAEIPGAPYVAPENLVSVVTVDPSGQFVYAAGYADVLAFGLNPSTGGLTLLGRIPARLGPFELAISKGAAAVTYVPEFAYVASSGAPIGGGKNGANDISGYAISSSTGALTVLSGSPFGEGLFPESLATDLFGQFLYVANNCNGSTCAGAGTVSAYTIDPAAGSLTLAGGSPFLAGINPIQVAVDPSGRFVYVVNSGDNTISVYAVNSANLTLTPVAGSPFSVTLYGTGVNAIAVDPSGLSLYVTVTCLGNCVSGGLLEYSVQATGALQFFQSYSVASPQSITIDPAGGMVFVPGNTSNAVSGFLAQRAFVSGPGNYLSAITGSPFASGQGPVAGAADPTGKFLYVVNQGSNNISAYTIDPVAGTLTPIPGSPFLAGVSPVSVTVDISGTYVYVVNSGDNTVSAFSVNATSGVLTPVALSPFAADTAPISVVTVGKVQ